MEVYNLLAYATQPDNGADPPDLKHIEHFIEKMNASPEERALKMEAYYTFKNTIERKRMPNTEPRKDNVEMQKTIEN